MATRWTLNLNQRKPLEGFTYAWNITWVGERLNNSAITLPPPMPEITAVISEMVTWCDEQWGAESCWEWDQWTFYFIREQDAMAFKMRWG